MPRTAKPKDTEFADLVMYSVQLYQGKVSFEIYKVIERSGNTLIFNKAIGMGFGRYSNRWRVSEIKELLATQHKHRNGYHRSKREALEAKFQERNRHVDYCKKNLASAEADRQAVLAAIDALKD